MDPRTLRLAAIPIGLVLVLGAFYALNRSLTSDVIGRNVTVSGVDVAGLTPEEATTELTIHGDLLSGIQIPLVAGGEVGEVSPLSIGFEPDVDAAVEAAFAVGRSEGFFGDLASWFRRLGSAEDVPLPVDVDPLAFEGGMTFIDEQLIGDPPFPGDVELVEGEPTARYPTAGTQVDREAAEPMLVDAYLATSRAPVDLPTVDATPAITNDDVDAAVDEARQLLAGPITLTSEEDDRSLTFDIEDLEAAFAVRIDDEAGEMVVDLSDEALMAKIDPLVEELSTPPVNAELVFNRDSLTASVRPGRDGTRIDADLVEAELLTAATTSERRGTLPLEISAEPDVTTEYLEGLGITHLVSRFTTYHACCENRVVNIQLIADAADETIVPPGGTFDLNAIAGRRTEEKGYLPAGGILRGEIDEEIIGGGVSQFTTTLYNAVFWGGYEDVDHKPHSYYFSRYPMGIEATLDYVSVPLIWRNNDTEGAYVNTYYTDTSITVEIWGNNDGRATAGHQRDGRLSTWTLVEGGDDAKIVTAEVSEPYDVTEPAEELIANPDVTPGDRRRVESGITGFTVDITRRIEHRGETTTQNWRWRYLAKPVRYEVHPCNIPGGPACPAPTTTTTAPPSTTEPPPPSTDTTAPPDTTTTTAPPDGG